MVEVMNKQKVFPWLKTFLKNVMKNFPNDCPEDLLQCLLENVNNEMKANSTKHNRKRQKALFETVLDLFLHCWWKIQWKRKKTWKNSWKKDCSKEVNHDFRTKCAAKLLYCIIYLGIILSKGVSDSSWVSRTLQAMQVIPDYNIVCTSLLLIPKLKRKFRPSYCAILKNFVSTQIPKCNLDPLVYVKVMVLFRELKLQLEDASEKREIRSFILQFQAPSTLIPWMTSYNLDVEKLKHKSITQQLFKKSFRDLFKKLKLIIADLESLSFGKRQKDANRTENIESQINTNSTSNLPHSSKEFNIEGNKSAHSRVNERRLKKEKSESGTMTNLVKAHSLVVNENVTMDLTPPSPTNDGTLDKNENDVNIDLCSDNSVITRQEHITLQNNSENIEQLCTSFTSDTNFDLNQTSDSIALNLSMKRPYSESTNDGSSESQSMNKTNMCNTSIEIGSNQITFSQKDMLHHSPTATCSKNTLVIDCNFRNNSDCSQSEIRPKNPDFSSIKVVFNLNNKQCGGLFLQNELDRNNQLVIKSLDSNVSGNSFINHFSVPLRTARLPEVVPQGDGYHSTLREIDSLKTSRHMHDKTSTPVALSSITNKKSNASTLIQETLNNTPVKKSSFLSPKHFPGTSQRCASTFIQETLNNTPVKKNNSLSPLKLVPNTSQRSTSMDGSDFRTPHTSECEAYSDDESNLRSMAIFRSPQFRLSKELESAPNPILASPRLQNEHDHHSRKDFSQSRADKISSPNSSLSGKKYRSFATQIYSEISCDDSSVSSISDISDEDTDHSLIKTLSGRLSSESPQKKKISSSRHSKKRTISTSSINCHSNANNSCHKNEVYFCSLHCGKMNNLRLTSKCRTSHSTQTKTYRRKTKKAVRTPSVYNLRPRRSIGQPKHLKDYSFR